MSKQKYTQQIAKLCAAPGRLKEQVTGRLILYWKEHLKQGKTKTCAVLVDGQTYTDVLTLEAWGDADQGHADKYLLPQLGQCVSLENAKIAPKSRTTVFHSKQIKLAYDTTTFVQKREDNESFANSLPLLTIQELPKLASYCAMSLVACIETVNEKKMRPTDGVSKPVVNLQVAFKDQKIDAAFWGEHLANAVSQCTKGEVYRFDWMTLVIVEPKKSFKLVSNNGTKVERLTGTEADSVRDGIEENLTSMSPQYHMTREDKLKLTTSLMSLSLVCHMRDADISQDNSNAYKCAVVIPCVYLKDVRSLGDSASGLPYYLGCPQCRKSLDRADGKCAEHGSVTPEKIKGAAVILQDPSTTMELTLWKEPLEALCAEFDIGSEVDETEILSLLAQKAAVCPLIARMAVGINKNGKNQSVDLFDLSSAISKDGILTAFHDMPSPPVHNNNGVARLCCQNLHQDDMGQLQAKFDSHTRSIGDAICLFRANADPQQSFVEGVEGLVVNVQAKCCICHNIVTLQQAGAPQTVQTMNRMRVGELALANVILQSDGKQPFEVMLVRAITAEETYHEKLHKFEASEYQKLVTGSNHVEIMTTPCKKVQELLSTPRDRKRLRVQTTNDMSLTK